VVDYLKGTASRRVSFMMSQARARADISNLLNANEQKLMHLQTMSSNSN